MKEIWLVAIEVDEDVVANSYHSFMGALTEFFDKSWEGLNYSRPPFKALVGKFEWREDMHPILIKNGEIIGTGDAVPRPSNDDLRDQFHELARRK